MKTFYTIDDFGRRGGHDVSFHDGVSTHRDGSPFFDIIASAVFMWIIYQRTEEEGLHGTRLFQ